MANFSQKKFQVQNYERVGMKIDLSVQNNTAKHINWPDPFAPVIQLSYAPAVNWQEPYCSPCLPVRPLITPVNRPLTLPFWLLHTIAQSLNPFRPVHAMSRLFFFKVYPDQKAPAYARPSIKHFLCVSTKNIQFAWLTETLRLINNNEVSTIALNIQRWKS